MLSFLNAPFINETTYVDVLIRVALSILIGGAIGFERERHNRPAGLRTHMLVCMGACVIAIIECELASQITQMKTVDSGITMTIGRIVAQVVSGVGFLGAGTIILSKRRISGLTTAASLWNAACLGLALGYGMYLLAVISCLMTLLVLAVISRIIHVNTEKRVEIKFVHRAETLEFINSYFNQKKVQVMDVDFYAKAQDDHNLYTNLYQLKLPRKTSYAEIVGHLSEYPNIESIRTMNV